MCLNMIGNWKLFLIFIQIITTCGQNFTDEEIRLIDDTVAELRKCKNIPGLGISLVRNGNIWSKGYGQAKLDPPVSFDEFTISNIASLVKAFTAALLGVLITESRRGGGSLGWQSKVGDILGPDFQMSTDCVTSEMTIKDLLTHRTGARNVDFALITLLPNISRAAYVSRLKHLPLTNIFRDEWDYNNLMYMIAGHVAEVIGGKPFEALIKEKIFDPLGMNASIFMDDTSSRNEHFAYPYFLSNGNLSFNTDDFLLYRTHDLYPDVGLCSSPNDLSKWLIFLLGNGTCENGHILLDKEVFDEMFDPHIPISKPAIDRFTLTTPFPVRLVPFWYGYGWFGRYYRDHKSLFHTGSFHAYSAITSLYPQAISGFFILVNGPWPVNFRTDLDPLSYMLSDILLQEEPWLNSSTICSFPEPWVKKPKPKNQTEANLSTKDYDVTPFLGTYGHRIYGDVVISKNTSSKKLLFKVNTVGEGDLILLYSENSTFRMNFAGRFPLILGSGCEARFVTQSGGLFQTLQLNCFGKFEYDRGISFLSENNSASSGNINTFAKSLITVIMNYFFHLYQTK